MNTIIIYTSMTGNTERMAYTIAKELTQLGDKVEIRDAYESDVEELESFDRILVGSYTWGDGEIPDEIIDFYEDLQKIDLAGKMAAVFGSGDSSYQHFARAVDLFEQALKRQGSSIMVEGLKLETESPEETVTKSCITFADKLKAAVKYV